MRLLLFGVLFGFTSTAVNCNDSDKADTGQDEPLNYENCELITVACPAPGATLEVETDLDRCWGEVRQCINQTDNCTDAYSGRLAPTLLWAACDEGYDTLYADLCDCQSVAQVNVP